MNRFHYIRPYGLPEFWRIAKCLCQNASRKRGMVLVCLAT